MKSRQSRLLLVGLALGILCALVIAPQTRWLVRLQTWSTLRLYHPFLSSGAQSYTLSQADDARQVQTVLAQHPNDFDLAYAQAVAGDSSTQSAARLRALEPRFRDRAALYAGILRRAVADLHWNRLEETHLYDLPQTTAPPPVVPNAPETLAACDRDAAAGERLDPDNAYFPIMRAIVLFAANRDIEAQAAVERSAHESGWREYISEEVEARWRLHQLAYGDPGAFPRSAIAFTTLLPQYAKMRALARLLLYQATQKEQAGQFEDGLKQRTSLRHYGDLMRVHSTWLIGSLVGIAICAIATGNPGGVHLPEPPPGLKPEQSAQRRLDAWSAYVTRLGHPELAAQARADEDTRRQIQAIAGQEPLLTDLTGQIFRLAAWWLAGLAVLANILWLLMFGGLAALWTRGRWEPKPLPSGTAGGVSTALGLSVLLTALCLMNSLDNLREYFPFYLVVFVLLPGAIALMAAVLRPRLRRSVAVWALSCVLTLAVFGVVGPLAFWQAHSVSEPLAAVNALTNSSGNSDETHPFLDLNLVISTALALAVPLLLGIVSSIAARVRRVPVSVGFVQGIRTAVLPLICLLLLAYGGLLFGTVRQERVVNQGLWHTVHDEGPYLAAQAGLPWPGAVR